MIEFLKYIFFTPISSLTAMNILTIVAIVLSVVFLIKLMFTMILYPIYKKNRKFIYNMTHYNKVRCAHTQCPRCGRTLDKCVCAMNKDLSYRRRLKNYKKEMKHR